MGTYLSAIKRFWWLIVLGAAVSVGAYVAVLNHVNGIPPKLSTRFHPTYKASTQLLLTSSNHPFIRTATITTDTVTVDDKVKTQTGAHAPDITTLINAANLYPRLINSDQVAKIRKAKFGDLPGKVSSEPVSGPQFQSNFHASVLPLVQIDAVANTPAQAIALDQHTADAFRMWLVGAQDKAKIPISQRILISQLAMPFSATTIGKPRTSLAIFAALLTMAGFFLAAVALDGAFPRKARRTTEVLTDSGSGNGTGPTGAPLASASHSEV